jgi:hypothetical protein
VPFLGSCDKGTRYDHDYQHCDPCDYRPPIFLPALLYRLRRLLAFVFGGLTLRGQVPIRRSNLPDDLSDTSRGRCQIRSYFRRFLKELKTRTKRSTIFTAVIVGSFAAVVAIALVVTQIMPGSPQGTTLSFQELSLFGGDASVHSYTASCKGAAVLEVYVQNPTPNPIMIQNATIYGNGVINATVYITLNNGCLTLSEAGPSVPAGGDYQLEGYVNAPLAFSSVYRCIVIFSNGQVVNQSLIAGT